MTRSNCVTSHRRSLRRARPGDWWLFARRVPGLNRSWIHRRAFRNVAGASTRAAGTLPGPHRHHELSNHLVDHWFSTLCGHHHPAHSQPPIRPHLPMTTVTEFLVEDSASDLTDLDSTASARGKSLSVAPSSCRVQPAKTYLV